MDGEILSRIEFVNDWNVAKRLNVGTIGTDSDFNVLNRSTFERAFRLSEAVPPIWELRVGEYRLFYDVSEEEAVVYIRAIRRKPRGKRTEDIL